MLGQSEDQYWAGEWQGPVIPLDPVTGQPVFVSEPSMPYPFENYGPEAPALMEPTIPDLPPFDFPSIDFGGGGIDWGMPAVEPIQDVFSGMFDNIPAPTYEQYNVFNEPGGDNESFLDKLWGGIKDFGKGLTFGAGGGSTAGGTTPIAPGSPNYPNYGPSQGGSSAMLPLAILAGGAVLLFAMKGRK